MTNINYNKNNIYFINFYKISKYYVFLNFKLKLIIF